MHTVKVYGAGPVLVDLVNDAVELHVGQLGVELVEDLLQGGRGDVAVAVLYMKTKHSNSQNGYQNGSQNRNFFGKKVLFPPGIEPGTFRVLGGCDNHYTTETGDMFWS